MKVSVFSDLEWIYPDTPLGTVRAVEAEGPGNGHTGFQLLGEEVPGGAAAGWEIRWDTAGQTPDTEAFELIDVGVDENTGAELFTTTDYGACREFVTRRAPFRVYDALRPFCAPLQGKRLALYFRFSIPDSLTPGEYRGTLTLRIAEDKLQIPVSLRVYPAQVPRLERAKLSVLNFFNYENLALQHGLERDSDAYWEMFRRYVRAQLEMRSTAVMLPPAEPVYTEKGALRDFDFQRTVRAAEIAFQEGVKTVCGGHVAVRCDVPPYGYVLSWQRNVPATEAEGYFQLRAYFSKWAELAEAHGWKGRVMQSLADEPQPYSEMPYRALSAVCRKFLPGIPILEAVETAELGGSVDIWVPKQDHFEKNREAYERLMEAGEPVWFYTCAFPAGKIMNRSMDLPLPQCREVFWMGFAYGLAGYLHWGFNFYEGDDLWNEACTRDRARGKKYPAGDAHLVYPGKEGPWLSMRLEAQRGGAEDYELLLQLEQQKEGLGRELVQRVCTSFRDYCTDPAEFAEARHLLLERISRRG